MASDPQVAAAYERIDPIQSTSEMWAAVAELPGDLRRKVVLHALGRSRFQFWWSLFAERCGIPEADWPEAPALPR